LIQACCNGGFLREVAKLSKAIFGVFGPDDACRKAGKQDGSCGGQSTS
jgi:hypothetical protein